jgi:Domain of unknown function (DUF4440)
VESAGDVDGYRRMSERLREVVFGRRPRPHSAIARHVPAVGEGRGCRAGVDDLAAVRGRDRGHAARPLQGWDKVRDDLYVNFLQKSLLERDLKASNIHIDVNGDSAWAVFDWTFSGKLANSQPLNSKGWESHAYKKVDGSWRIAHLHYSGQMPQSQ